MDPRSYYIPSQDIPAENLPHQNRDKKITSSLADSCENGNTGDLLCALVREQAAQQKLLY